MRCLLAAFVLILLTGCFPKPPEPEVVVENGNTTVLFEEDYLVEMYPGHKAELARVVVQDLWRTNDLPNPECLDHATVYILTRHTFDDYGNDPTDWGVSIDYSGFNYNGRSDYWLFVSEGNILEATERDVTETIAHELIHTTTFCVGQYGGTDHGDDGYSIPLWIEQGEPNSLEAQAFCNLGRCP